MAHVPPETPHSARRYTDAALYRRLLREAAPHWPHLLGLFLVQLLATPIALLVPVPLQVTVDCVLGTRPPPGWLAAVLPDAWEAPNALLMVAAVGVVLVTVLVQAQEMVAWIYRTWVGERLVLDLRARLFGHLQRLSLAFHDAGGTAQSVYRVQSDASAIEAVLVQGLVRIVTVVLRIVVLVWVTWRIDSTLVLIALVGAPVMFLLTRIYRARLRARWREAKERETSAMTVVTETLAAMRVVKAFGQEERERRRFQDEARRGLDANVAAVSSHGGFDLLVGLTVGLLSAAVLYVGANQVRAGALTLGDLLLVVGYLGQLLGPLREVGTKVADLQRAMAGAERTFALLDEKPEAEDRPGARPLERARGEIAFRSVSFGFAPGTPLLEDVTFHVPAGSRVGIAGRTGSGKTTLLSLHFRFNDPTA
ncbi:MAG TPA: ABC transporter ATP-binding protein, partial [Planctomycetota bacterium]|nr:ABC transporter ATP-binding protein [Planctomycetota bacterium]